MFFDDEPSQLPTGTFAKGNPTSLGEVFSSSHEAFLKRDLHSSRQIASEEAYDTRISQVRDATGVELENPWRTSGLPMIVPTKAPTWGIPSFSIVSSGSFAEDSFGAFNQRLKELAEKHPEHAEIIGADRSIGQDAVQLQRDAVAQADDIYARGPTGSFAAGLAAGVVASFQDPVNVAAMLAGPWNAVGRGVRPILTNALKVGLINAGVELGSFPAIRDWRREAGFDYTSDELAMNALAAAIFGGTLDAGGRSLYRAGQRAAGRVPRLNADGGVIGYDAGSPDVGSPPGVKPGVPNIPPDLAARAEAGDQAAMAEIASLMDSQGPALPEGLSQGLVSKALEGDLEATRSVGERLGLMDDPTFKGALEHAELTGPLDFETSARLRAMGVDDGEGLQALLEAIKAEADGTPFPVLVPESVGAPTVRLRADEVGLLISERPVEISRLREALRSELERMDPRLAQYIEGAIAAGIEDLLPPLRGALDQVADGADTANVARSLATQVAETVQKLGFEDFALQALVHGGRGSPVEAARLIRAGATVDSGMPLATDYMRTARALSAMSDAAFEMVERGEVPVEVATVVAERVDQAMHVSMLTDLKELGVTDPAEALGLMPDLLPSNAQTINATLLGVSDPQLREMPLRGGSEVEEPNGPAAVKQVARLEKELAPEIAEAIAAAPSVEAPRTAAEAITRARGVREAIAQVADMVPEGVSVRTFSSIDELPTDVHASVLRANGVAFSDALRRLRASTTEEARVKARSDLDAIKAGRGIEALTQDSAIWIATYAVNPQGRVAHEVVHALKTMGKLGPDEIRLLAERGRQVGSFDPAREYLYRTELEGRGYDAAKVAEVLDEEAAAHLIEARANGLSFGAGVDSIVDRIRRVLEMIGNALRLRGFRTADDVVDAVLSGEVARRASVGAWMRDQDIFAVAVDTGSRPISAVTERGSRAGHSRVTTPDGTATYPVAYEVVDAAALTPARGNLQPRDRATRAASQAQIQEMAGRLNPDLLVHSAQSDRGAPIVDQAGTVLSGNGRLAAIRTAEQMGTSGYQAYLARLEAEGFNIAGVESPVLVRRLVEPMDDATKREFVVKSNQDDKLAMSPAELARVDRDLMTNDTLALVDADGEAGLGSAANRRFVRAVLSKMSAAERGGLASEGGTLTPAGVARLEGAVFARAYDDRSLITRIVEDQEGAGVRNALIAAAPSWAQMRAVASPVYDITDQLLEAVNVVAMLRERRLKPAEHFAQADAFSQPTPEMRALVRAFFNESGTRAAAWRTTRDLLKEYARIAMDQSRAVGDLLGSSPKPADILEGLLRRRGSGDNEPAMLFAFAGPKARSADLDKLSKAQAMDRRGKSRFTIWKATGWFMGVDGKWRFEISDKYDIVPAGAGLREVGAHMLTQAPALRELVDGTLDSTELHEIFSHPDLFAAYPEIPYLSVQPEEPGGASFGYGVFGLGENYLRRAAYPDRSQDVAHSTKVMMHEAQHAIQGMEWFARGGSPEEFAIRERGRTILDDIVNPREVSEAENVRRHLMYRRLAGEVESRTVEKRMRMTAEERAARPPWLDYDTPEDKQIVRFAMRDASGFTSRLDEVLSTFRPTDTVTLDTLSKKGVKKAELEARGLLDLLDGKGAKVSDLQEVAGKNRVDVKEVAYGGSGERQTFDNADDASRLIARAVGWDGPVRLEPNSMVRGYPGFDVIAVERPAGLIRKAKERLLGDVADLGDGRFHPHTNESRAAQVALDDYAPGAAGPQKWQWFSLDPSNPTYRETVLHLPAERRMPFDEYRAAYRERFPKADVSDAEVRSYYERGVEIPGAGQFKTTKPDVQFSSGHWSEPNVIAHARTSIQKDAQGKDVFVVNELQSDWGQKLRDGGVRDEAKIEDLRKRAEQAEAEWREVLQDKDAYQIAPALVNPLDQVPYGFDRPLNETGRRIRDNLDLVSAELRTAEASTPGHPLVNTTDQWVNTGLRKMIMEAVESGSDQIAIPSGDTVLSFGMGGKSDGIKYAYDQMYPKNLRNILKKIDPSIEPQKVDHLYGQQGQTLDRSQGFVTFKITDKVRSSIQSEGMPLFAMRDMPSDVPPKEALNSINPAALTGLASRLSSAIGEGLPVQAISDTIRAELLERVGIALDSDQALAIAQQMVDAGADNIDGETSILARAGETEKTDATQSIGGAAQPTQSRVPRTPLSNDIASMQRMQEMQRLSEACPA